jgi:predicted nucleic acid-binding protein
MVKELFKAIGAVALLLGAKESKEYSDELLKLEKEWFEEYEKPIDQRSDDDLARLDQRLRSLNKAICVAASAKAAAG